MVRDIHVITRVYSRNKISFCKDILPSKTNRNQFINFPEEDTGEQKSTEAEDSGKKADADKSQSSTTEATTATTANEDKSETEATKKDDAENKSEKNEDEDDQEHLELTVVDSDKLDTSNVDNDDSLNLTIGEDEAKIFQDEVCTIFLSLLLLPKYLRIELNFTLKMCIRPFQETDEKVKENNSE